MGVLVAVSSKRGATEEIAEAIGRGRLGFGERAMALAFRAPEGDFRDWYEIDAWAGEIAAALRR